jgi:hypothetical protein
MDHTHILYLTGPIPFLEFPSAAFYSPVPFVGRKSSHPPLVYADSLAAREERGKMSRNGGNSFLARVYADLAWQPDSGIQGSHHINEAKRLVERCFGLSMKVN